MSNDIFAFLVIGVQRLVEQDTPQYPYPPELQYSLNVLALSALSKKKTMPKTLTGLLSLFEQPVKDWWGEGIPPDFSSDEPLLEDGDLSFEAIEYLEALLPEPGSSDVQKSLHGLQTIIDNGKFKALLDQLRAYRVEDPKGTQEAYVLLRRFLIEHPFANILNISQTFSENTYISFDDVANLYLETASISELMTLQDSAGDSVFWQCEHCGPLYLKQKRLTSIKQTACGEHCPKYQDGWQTVPRSRQLRVLRKGIHFRVCLPGIPELKLLKWLEEQQAEYPTLIEAVHPWPGIDTYDLQIRFRDSVWAIDMKDYHKPEQLGRKLRRLYGEGNLRWDRGFYVYPAYREKQQLDYGQIVRSEIKTQLTNTEIISDDQFKDRVRRKLNSLKSTEV